MDTTDRGCPPALLERGEVLENRKQDIVMLHQLIESAADVFSQDEVAALHDAVRTKQNEVDTLSQELQNALHLWQTDIAQLESKVETRSALIQQYQQYVPRAALQKLAAKQAELLSELEAVQAAIGITPAASKSTENTCEPETKSARNVGE